MALEAQKFLKIKEIKEGVLVLKDGSLRGVIIVSSTNFALKSEEEKEAIFYQFQTFLNSLDFSIEILVQSRKLNITPYLDKLKVLEEKEENELLKIQLAGYREFIKNLVAKQTIMTKNFFVVVPFFPSKIPVKEEKEAKTISEFEKNKIQLLQRMEFVMTGLRRCGLSCAPLDTLELIELFWSWYHQEESEVGYYPRIPPELVPEIYK